LYQKKKSTFLYLKLLGSNNLCSVCFYNPCTFWWEATNN